MVLSAGQSRLIKYASWKCSIIEYILDVSNHQQWTKHISNHELLREFGMNGGLSCALRKAHERARSCL